VKMHRYEVKGTTTTTTILWLSGLCPDNPGEPVPEGTFCHLLDFLVE